MRRSEQRKPVVIVTGASTGIGLAIAERLNRDGSYQLVLTARSSSLSRFNRATFAPSTLFLALDVTKASERAEVIAEVLERFERVDYLINNAGLALRTVVEEASAAEMREQFAVNFEGPLALARLVLPSMRAARAGHIINISSVGGMMAMPTMGAYSASKFALEGASESLYYELRPFNVHVTLLQPGFINSDGFSHVRYTEVSQKSSQDEGAAYYAHYRSMASFIEKVMHRVPATPITVANKVARLMRRKRPPLRAAGTLDAVLFSWMRRLLPRPLYHEVLYALLPQVRSWGRSSEKPDSML